MECLRMENFMDLEKYLINGINLIYKYGRAILLIT